MLLLPFPQRTLHFPTPRHFSTSTCFALIVHSPSLPHRCPFSNANPDHSTLFLILIFTLLPPNLLVGDVIWQRMLRYGAGRDSKEMLQDLEKP